MAVHHYHLQAFDPPPLSSGNSLTPHKDRATSLKPKKEIGGGGLSGGQRFSDKEEEVETDNNQTILTISLPISSLFPYLYFMIKDFHIAKEEEDIGFYAGFVASSFMIGRVLTSIFWGKLADRNGRKPIILIGNFS
ncbi:unnamed protein product [Cochlearia groenlandica]